MCRIIDDLSSLAVAATCAQLCIVTFRQTNTRLKNTDNSLSTKTAQKQNKLLFDQIVTESYLANKMPRPKQADRSFVFQFYKEVQFCVFFFKL
jgi:hypothetical protein